MVPQLFLFVSFFFVFRFGSIDIQRMERRDVIESSRHVLKRLFVTCSVFGIFLFVVVETMVCITNFEMKINKIFQIGLKAYQPLFSVAQLDSGGSKLCLVAVARLCQECS